mmetsp:Transcript_72915/g.211068  ORF Transcript_72915/g.211068 Transcript_72915/m.211068 type:complete len:250 (+) Transcript_72915:1005-1754(+)
MREASCESEADRSRRARSRTKRAAARPATSAPEASCERATCKSETCANAPDEVASSMTFFAVARAVSSSPRLFVSASKSSARVMHSWCRSARPLVSDASSLEVLDNSPSALDFFSPAAAMPALASSISFSPYRISSFNDCSMRSKACWSCVSFFRASSSCVSASSKRSERTCTMFPLWLSYTAAAGAPGSSSSPRELLWRNAEIWLASAVVSLEASTSTDRACPKLPALFNCTMDAPPCISRSRIPTAR